MTEKSTNKPSLVRKLASVMGACERVPKTGYNKFHNYAYATESDITAGVRSAMAEQGVMMIPTVEKVEWSDVTTGSGKKERLCTVSWLFTLLDADSDSKIEFRNIGQGQDSGDKAFYKAATGAVKYALLKLFLIPTGDDPEAASPEADASPSMEEVAARTAEISKAKAERADGIKKLVAAFEKVGRTAEQLATQLGHPIEAITNEEWAALRKQYAELEAKTKDPDEAARIEVQRQSEAALAKAGVTGSTPQNEKQAAALLAASIFASFVDRLRAAKTEQEVVLIWAEFGSAKLPAGEMKALQRAYKDRLMLIAGAKQDAANKIGPHEDVPL